MYAGVGDTINTSVQVANTTMASADRAKYAAAFVADPNTEQTINYIENQAPVSRNMSLEEYATHGENVAEILKQPGGKELLKDRYLDYHSLMGTAQSKEALDYLLQHAIQQGKSDSLEGKEYTIGGKTFQVHNNTIREKIGDFDGELTRTQTLDNLKNIWNNGTPEQKANFIDAHKTDNNNAGYQRTFNGKTYSIKNGNIEEK
jgi:hypothetical protein